MISPGLDPLLQAAIDKARQGLPEVGIPMGSLLVIEGPIIGRGDKMKQRDEIRRDEVNKIRGIR